MTYRDELNPGFEESERESQKLRASCNHTYKKIFSVDGDDGLANAYLCTQCSDKQVVLEGEESRLAGEIVD